ncbi:unnamed protein product [Cladocopium goreaui]|uniref:Uncharacterized protein n=1 Tax=Cladocopium goreaui TaxID=2562237 RepID=A0A9P1GI07_9DINO|nr:unnamed protein product [Cladocopium goreaui]
MTTPQMSHVRSVRSETSAISKMSTRSTRSTGTPRSPVQPKKLPRPASFATKPSLRSSEQLEADAAVERKTRLETFMRRNRLKDVNEPQMPEGCFLFRCLVKSAGAAWARTIPSGCAHWDLDCEEEAAGEEAEEAEEAEEEEEEAAGEEAEEEENRFRRETFYPLHYAVLENDAEMVNMLLIAGSDPRQKSSKGRRPEDLARDLAADGNCETLDNLDKIIQTLQMAGNCETLDNLDKIIRPFRWRIFRHSEKPRVRTKFLRVIQTLTHYSDIVSEIPSGSMAYMS